MTSFHEALDLVKDIEDEERRELLRDYLVNKSRIEEAHEERIERLEKDLVNKNYKIQCLQEVTTRFEPFLSFLLAGS